MRDHKAKTPETTQTNSVTKLTTDNNPQDDYSGWLFLDHWEFETKLQTLIYASKLDDEWSKWLQDLQANLGMLYNFKGLQHKNMELHFVAPASLLGLNQLHQLQSKTYKTCQNG